MGLKVILAAGRRNPSAAPPLAQSPRRPAAPRLSRLAGRPHLGEKRGGGGTDRLPFREGLPSVAEGHSHQNCAWGVSIANGEVVRAQDPPLETGTPPPPVPQAPGPPVALGLGSFFYRAPFLALCPGRPICPGLPGRCPDLYVP